MAHEAWIFRGIQYTLGKLFWGVGGWGEDHDTDKKNVLSFPKLPFPKAMNKKGDPTIIEGTPGQSKGSEEPADFSTRLAKRIATIARHS